MNIEIIKPIGGGTVKAVASKSHAHRILICAALAKNETYVECGEMSDDIGATVGCLESLGANIKYDGTGFMVKPIARPILGDSTITQYCGESGSTLRFMLPICCALGVPAEFIMAGRLSERPMSPLLNQLESHGCEIIQEYDAATEQDGTTVLPYQNRSKDSSASGGGNDLRHTSMGSKFRCTGKLSSGVFELPGNISSQFISGLLLALSLLTDDSVLSIVGREESRPYIAMTLDALSTFCVKIKRFATNPAKGAAYRIKGAQNHRSLARVSIEGDWSNAAFWLCAGAIGNGSVTCTGLNLGSTQGDMGIIRLLERFGANVTYEGDSVTVSPAKLRGIQIDAIDIPDLVPALSVVASVAEGETLINNAGRLRLKESDRLQSITETLYALGANITESRSNLIIKGGSSLQGGTVSSFNDHRIVMMAALASVACNNPVKINDTEAVNKSYPGFFKDYEALGGKIKIGIRN